MHCQRLAWILFMIQHTQARTVRYGCNGISPNGARWTYALAEHTATVTVHTWLATRDWLGHNKTAANFSIRDLPGDPHGMLPCLHSHEAAAPPLTNFTFAFATNPFRRVLSNAAHRGVISGTRFGFVNKSVDEVVRRFRSFVMGQGGAGGGGLQIRHNHMIPRAIWVQSSMLSHYPQPPQATMFVGRTSTLDASMRELLPMLGYDPAIFSGFVSSHCSASCKALTSNLHVEQKPYPPPASPPAPPPRRPSRHGGYADHVSKGRRLELDGIARESSAVDAGQDPADTADSPLPLLRRILNEAATQEGVNNIKAVKWYDHETAKRVVGLFNGDFKAYGFSTDPDDMWK
jgi:hypothetical protein